VDVEGLCRGIDRELVEKLGQWTPLPTTYAGGAKSLGDLEEVTRLGRGKVDLTIGSALDIFGGSGVKYEDCVEFNRRCRRELAAYDAGWRNPLRPPAPCPDFATGLLDRLNL